MPWGTPCSTSSDSHPKKPKEAKAKGVINQQNNNFYQFQHSKFRCSQNATNQLKSTIEFDYMCPRGRLGPPALTFTKQLKYEQRLLLRCIHHFKSDVVYNMDHMRISGIEPSPVILIQRKQLKRMKNNVTKVPKAKRNGVINPQNYNVYQFQHSKFRCSQNASNQLKSAVELGNICHGGLLAPPALTFTKLLKYEQRLLLRCIHHLNQIQFTIWTIGAFRVLNTRQ